MDLGEDDAPSYRRDGARLLKWHIVAAEVDPSRGRRLMPSCGVQAVFSSSLDSVLPRGMANGSREFIVLEVLSCQVDGAPDDLGNS
jgi:hypothetical protein